jgi:hypothetical protein
VALIVAWRPKLKVRLTKNLQVVSFTEFYFLSLPTIVQVVLSTAHLAKFSEAVTKALSTSQGFDLERDRRLKQGACQKGDRK